MSDLTLTQTSAFEQFKPLATNIENKIIERVTKQFDLFVAKYGEKHPGYISTRTSDYEIIKKSDHFNQIVKYIKVDGYSSKPKGQKMILNTTRLIKDAKEIGNDSVLGFVIKLITKIGDVKMEKLNFLGDGSFTIKSKVNNKDIFIEQQTVYKTSNLGKFFVQFPARIYVDGKFTPASKFKDAIK